MNNYEERKNANYILEKEYADFEKKALTHDVEELTKLGARLSISIGFTKIKLFVFCRTNGSKVYERSTDLDFYEIGIGEMDNFDND